MRTICLFAALALCPKAVGADRRTVVFCVGIEQYDKTPSLNTVKYVAEDAHAVWCRLREVVPNFDERRSYHRVADREKMTPKTPPCTPAPAADCCILHDDLNRELKKFLANLEPTDLAIIYLGGHGMKREDKVGGVHYLASDYEDAKGVPQNAIDMSELLRKIATELRGRSKGAEVVVFANMCHAGAITDDLGDLGGGAADLKLAYIPACADVNLTYEKEALGGSVFAHELLAALGGATTLDGKVTTSTVAERLKKHPDIREGQFRLPKDEIVLGTIRAEQLQTRRFLANSLLAVGADATGTDRDVFVQLADSHFERCRLDRPAKQTDPRDYLSSIQCKLLLPQPTALDVKALLAAKPLFPPHPLVEKLEPAKAGVLEPRPFVAVVVERLPVGPGSVPLDHRSVWTAYLWDAPGCVHVESIDAYTVRNRVDVKQIAATAREKARGQAVDLVFVFSGSVFLTDEPPPRIEGPLTPANLVELAREWPAEQRCVFVWNAPFGGHIPPIVKEKDCDGRVSLLVSTVHKNGIIYPEGEFSTDERIVKALKEKGTDLSAPLYTKVEKVQLAALPGRHVRQWEEFNLIPQPGWFGPQHPAFQPGMRVRSVLSGYGFPGPWWAGRFATEGVTEPDESWPDAIAPAANPKGIADLKKRFGDTPYSQLAWGAEYLAAREYQKAKASFEVFTAIRPALPPKVLRSLEDVHTNTRRQFWNIQVELMGRSFRAPTVHLVPVAAMDYHSQIGKLSGTQADIKAWEQAMKDRFNGRVECYCPEKATAAGVLASLDKACDECQEADIVVFVFSGRGFQTNADRYLATEDTRPFIYDQFGNMRSGESAFTSADGRTTRTETDLIPVTVQMTDTDGRVVLRTKFVPVTRTVEEKGPVPDKFDPELTVFQRTVIPVSRVSAAFGRAKGACLAVFDCQFSPPQADAVQVLDKHLNSIRTGRPIRADATPNGRRQNRIDPSESETLVRTLPNATNAAYVWWIGRLKESDAFSPKFGASPLSQALLQTLSGATDYHDWMKRARRLMHDDEPSFVPPPFPVVGEHPVFAPRAIPRSTDLLAFQGALKQPVLTPSGGTLPLRLLVAEYHRKRLNLNLALELAHRPTINLPQDAITRAALCVRSVQLDREMGLPPDERIVANLTKAHDDLLTLFKKNPEIITNTMMDDAVLIRSYTTELRGDEGPTAAVRELREWLKHPEYKQRNWPPRVHERLVTLTQTAVEQDIERMIQETRKALPSDKPIGGAAEQKLRQLEIEAQGPIEARPIVKP